MNLKGKNAIITGGSRGLGKAVAMMLAQEGVNVGVTGRNEKALKEVVLKLEKERIKAAYAVMDITSETAVSTGVEQLASVLGGIDILVNNAGTFSVGKIVETDTRTWENVIRTNLFGVYYTAKAVYPYLLKNGEGDVINVSSTAGLKGGANMSAYAASKAAVISLSQSMMAEWRKENIRVITLTPSTIATDMSINGGLTDGNPDKVVQPSDFAEWVRDILKMNHRAMIANGSIFSTNP